MSARKPRRWVDPLPAGAAGSRPLVAIVGRPNVGKSTLFNRLAGRKIAIVEDIAGVTRDRHYADADIHGKAYVLIDTGGLDPESEDPMKGSIATQVGLAIEEAQVIVCVLDATSDPTPADREAVRLLRRAAKPTIYVANKADSPGRAREAMSHYELGIEEVVPVSALHGHHMHDLESRIAEHLPRARAAHTPVGGKDARRVAIVGRPNAGKSSLVNRLLGHDRLVVDDRPGTTVDSVDSLLVRDGHELVLIDTAGMRKRRVVQKVRGVEGLSVIHAIRSMERSHAVVLLIDAEGGAGEQDVKIAALAEERGRALVVGLNKMDLMDRSQGNEHTKKTVARAGELLAGVFWAPIVPLSVVSGRGVDALMAAVDSALEEHNKRIPTGQLNRFFEEVIERHPPPTVGKRSVRLYYITQAEVRPPTFVIMANRPDDVHWSYRRYVERQLRERFGFAGSSIRVRYRQRRRRGDEPRDG
jgi:GTP-binding protein